MHRFCERHINSFRPNLLLEAAGTELSGMHKDCYVTHFKIESNYQEMELTFLQPVK